MVRKQNERTILLHYRIITLSLPTKTLFLILAPCPLSTRLGAFLSPRNIFPQIFSEIFSNLPRRLFSGFLVRKIMFSWGELFSTFMARKIMGVEGSCRSANGGGCSSFMLHLSYIWALPFVLRLSLSCSNRVKFSDEQGKNGQKLDFIWECLVFSRENRRQERAKT